MREFLQILRNKCFVLLGRIFVGNIAGLRLVFQQALELIDNVAQRQLSLKPMLTRRAEKALSHGLTRRGHFRCGAASACAQIMSHSLVLASQPFQLLRQSGGFLAQLILFLSDLRRSFRRWSGRIFGGLALAFAIALPLSRPLSFVSLSLTSFGLISFGLISLGLRLAGLGV